MNIYREREEILCSVTLMLIWITCMSHRFWKVLRDSLEKTNWEYRTHSSIFSFINSTNNEY